MEPVGVPRATDRPPGRPAPTAGDRAEDSGGPLSRAQGFRDLRLALQRQGDRPCAGRKPGRRRVHSSRKQPRSAGQSGVGKSHIVQSVGRAACALGYRVRYATSAELLRDLTASLADHSLPQRLRYYSNFELLVIDEFGFDKIERAESAQAASLLYKVVDSRGPNRSTALVTNISFDAWADYLGDAPLAMAILDRLVDGAIVLKIEGRSYRAHRSRQSATAASAEAPKAKQRRKSTK